MLASIYNTLLVEPIFNLLMVLFKFTGSLGISIIGLTILIKIVSTPLILPSLRSAKKQKDLQPQIEKIKEKYKYDKKKQAEMQMALLKEHGINPASGCTTMILTIIIFTALYSVINKITTINDLAIINNYLYFDFIRLASLTDINLNFLYLNLSKPDPFFIMAILAGLTQLIMAKMTMPYVEEGVSAAKKTPDKKDDIAYNMQQQSLYMMPIMMVILGRSMPSGVIIYIITSTVFSIFQTYFINGWGGLASWINKAKKLWIKR